jgi:hypothetical protein
LSKKAKVCLKQKSIKTYSAEVETFPINQENKTEVRLFLTFTERIIFTKDEVLIFSSIDLLSSLGGALGLFIGFSFFGYIVTLLDAVVDKCGTGPLNRCVY